MVPPPDHCRRCTLRARPCGRFTDVSNSSLVPPQSIIYAGATLLRCFIPGRPWQLTHSHAAHTVHAPHIGCYIASPDDVVLRLPKTLPSPLSTMRASKKYNSAWSTGPWTGAPMCSPRPKDSHHVVGASRRRRRHCVACKMSDALVQRLSIDVPPHPEPLFRRDRRRSVRKALLGLDPPSSVFRLTSTGSSSTLPCNNCRARFLVDGVIVYWMKKEFRTEGQKLWA